MSNQALAPSATMLTQTAHGEQNFPFAEVVNKLGEKKLNANGLTRQAFNLNPQKLISSVCAEYRAKFAEIYGKTDRLPSAVFDKISEEVNKWIASKLTLVNSSNAISLRRSFCWKSKDMLIVERVTATGENQISLEEQLFGVGLMIGQAERRLKDLEAKPTPDHEAEKTIKQRLMNLEATRSFIKGEIAHQAKVLAEANK